MRRQKPCFEHTTADEQRARLEWAHREVHRQDAAVREWLGSATKGRPSFAEAERAEQLGIPSCHLWEAPAIAPPTHLSAAQVLRAWQAEACAICSGVHSRLLVDHCHRTGLIRGLLCTSCNTAEAFSGAAVFVAYRFRPPAVMLQVEEQYGSPWDGFSAPSA